MQYLAAQNHGDGPWPADNRGSQSIKKVAPSANEQGAGILIWENVIKKFLSSGDP